MGKKQPKINNKKRRKTFNNPPSSKKSKKSNNYSKRNKKKFTYFSQSGHSSKKSSKKKFLENSSKYKERCEDFPIFTNITNNNKISNHNIFIFNSFYNIPKGRPEWMSEETEKIKDNNSRFSKEILEYVNYITPNNQSLSTRQSTMQILKQIIKRRKPEWKVHLFGSFRQGTSTVFSDLDFEILIDKNSSRKRDIDELYFLMKILRNNEFSNNIRLIRARVPILKATCSATGINIDISVNRKNGYEAADMIKKILSRHKILRPIIIILKILLKMNKLNEPHTGGMSSFLLFHLVYFFFIQYKNTNNTDNIEGWQQNNNNDNNNIKNNSNNKLKTVKNNEMYCEASSSESDDNITKSDKGITLTKAASITDDGYNSNDDDSNMVRNGSPSSDSEQEQKSDSNSNSNENIIENKLKVPYTSNSSDDYNNNNIEQGSDIQEEFIMEKNKILENYENIDIGKFLMDFLYFYGFKFNHSELGIKVTEDDICETFFKAERMDMDCSDTICAESIQEKGNDIGKSCYQYDKIKQIFFFTFNQIKVGMNNDTNSILQAINFPTV